MQDEGGTRANEFALLRCEEELAEASAWIWGSVNGKGGAYGAEMERTNVGLCMEFLRSSSSLLETNVDISTSKRLALGA